MEFTEILTVIDVLTCVEILKNGDRTIFKGKLKDVKIDDMIDYKILKISPCGTSRETYLEIDVY